MNHDEKTTRSRRARALMVAADVMFASAFMVALFGHWRAALVVIGLGLIPAFAVEVLRRR